MTRHGRIRRASTLLLALGAVACGTEAAELDDTALPQAAADAGCVVSEPDPDGDPDHIDPAEAPPADELYDTRPAASGPHFGQWLSAGVYDAPIDERAAVHNLEHGAIAVHHDPSLDADELERLRTWARERNEAGLANDAGAGLIVAPFEGGLSAPVAFRGWLLVADCDTFDTGFADTLLRERFGAAGPAPEGSLAPDADAVLDEAS